MLGALSLPPPTGNSLIPRGALLPDAPTADVQPMSPMESLAMMFSDMRDSLFAIAENTLKSNELLETAILGTPEQRRDAGISAEDRDPAPEKKEEDEEEGPGFLSRLGNQTKGFFGTLLGKGVVTGLALLATYVFEDQIIEGMGKFFKYMKEDFIPMITKLGIEIKDWFGRTWNGVQKFFGFVKNLFNALNDYVMQFDINEDGTLNEEEFGLLKEDIKEKAVNLISDFIGSVFDALKISILGGLFLGTATKALLGNAAVKAVFSGGTVARGFGAVGMSGAFGIAALIAYGITATYSNASKALQKTLDDNEGAFDFSDFMANFIGGREEGGVMNAFNQAYSLGGTGALAGMAIGTAIFPGVGTIIGGLVGLAGGALVGATTGYAGSGKMKKMFDDFGTMIDMAATDASNFFSDLVSGFRSMFAGESFMKGFKERGEADVEGLTSDLAEAERKLNDIKQLHADNPKMATIPYNQKILQDAQADVDRLRALVAEAPAKAKQLKITQIDDELQKKIEKRDKLQEEVDSGNLMPGIDALSKGIPFETQIAGLNAEIATLSGELEVAKNAQSMDELISVQSPADFSNSQFVMDQIMMEKYKALGMEFEPNEKGGGYIIMDNKDQSNKVLQENNTYSERDPYPHLSHGYVSGITN